MWGAGRALIMSMDEEQPARDAETRPAAMTRRNLYALVVHTTKSRQEMLEDVDLGDGNGAFKAIYISYYRNTTGGYQAAILTFYAGDTANDEVEIMGRAKQLIALGGQPMEKDKITVLLNGLRPDFALCITQLKMKTMAVSADVRVGLTFREALNELRDFATEEGLDKWRLC
jgi:hypothetical protein